MIDDVKSWHAGYHSRDHQVADLERMLRAAQSALAGQHAANARLQAERDAMRALLREARDDWIKVGYGASHEDVAACRDFCDRIDNMIGGRK